VRKKFIKVRASFNVRTGYRCSVTLRDEDEDGMGYDHNIATVRRECSYGSDVPGPATINWSAWGDTTAEGARLFATGHKHALLVAENFDRNDGMPSEDAVYEYVLEDKS